MTSRDSIARMYFLFVQIASCSSSLGIAGGNDSAGHELIEPLVHFRQGGLQLMRRERSGQLAVGGTRGISRGQQ